MSKFWESKWVYRGLSFLLAIGLFAYVDVSNLNNTRPSKTDDSTITATAEKTLKVPLQIDADTEKYFITGYPQKVDVAVEGSAALVTVTANTQNFRVIADLSKLGVGTHTVALKQEGINKELTYSIKPKTVTVNIQPRMTKTMPVKVKYNQASLAAGYRAGPPELSRDSVEITGARSAVKRVDQIVANVALRRDTKANVSQEVVLQALDTSGSTVNVVINPTTVRVKLPITLPSKKLPVTLRQTDEAPSGTSVKLSSDTATVRVYGPQEVLDRLDQLTVPVSVSGITRSQTKEYRVREVEPELTGADPGTLTVAITVTDNSGSSQARSQSSSSQNTASERSSTASGQ